MSQTKGIRKTYKKEFKAKVAAAAIVGEKNLAELANQYSYPEKSFPFIHRVK